MPSVKVRLVVEEQVIAPVARQLCEDFAEWLETQGLQIEVKAGHRGDDRSNDELARDFVAERLEQS